MNKGKILKILRPLAFSFVFFCLFDSAQSVDYTIACKDLVERLMSDVKAVNIEDTIRKMSSFKTRFYDSPEAIDSQRALLKRWKEFAGRRSNVTVGLHGHRWPKHLRSNPKDALMPSLILTIRGSELPEEIIVVGAHGDSIAAGPVLSGKTLTIHRFKEKDNLYSVEQYVPQTVSPEPEVSQSIRPILSEAPGANDNASGVGTITEMLYVLMKHDYRPRRTLQFIVYAGEEVGLIGSEEIAKNYRDGHAKVIGVLNFDMTSFKGSDDLDLVVVGHKETTDEKQNQFLGRLLDAYLPQVRWESPPELRGSDHTAWNEMGFAASMLTDSRRKDVNKHVHSIEDTLENTGGNAEHSVNFAKLGLAYIVELDK